MKLGIFGGTFDPIHHGHLIVAEECRDLLALDRIVFIPAKHPPHKSNVRISSGNHRLNMLRHALEYSPEFEAIDIELRRDGPSYTIDTLDAMRDAGELYLIMGHDSFVEFETWHRYIEILNNYRLVVVHRPGVTPYHAGGFAGAVRAFIHDRVWSPGTIPASLPPHDWKICFIPIPGLSISASQIRCRIQSGRTIRYLVPLKVEEYIRTNGLYQATHQCQGDFNEGIVDQ